MRNSTLAALFVTSLALMGCAKSPESAVEGFFTAVGKGEITEAQTYISAQVSGMLGPQKMSAALAQESERIRNCGGIKSIEVKLEGQGEVRSGTVVVSYAGECSPKSQRVRLIKEDGKWKIGANK